MGKTYPRAKLGRKKTSITGRVWQLVLIQDASDTPERSVDVLMRANRQSAWLRTNTEAKAEALAACAATYVINEDGPQVYQAYHR